MRRDAIIDEWILRDVSDLSKQELLMLDAALDDQKAEKAWVKQVEETWKRLVKITASTARDRERRRLRCPEEGAEEEEDETEDETEEGRESESVDEEMEAVSDWVQLVDRSEEVLGGVGYGSFPILDILTSRAPADITSITSCPSASHRRQNHADSSCYLHLPAKGEPVKKEKWYKVWKAKKARNMVLV